MTTSKATKDRVQLSFRHFASRKKMLEAFMLEDGHRELTPVLREAVDFYTAERLRRGKDAVRVDVPAVKVA